MAKNSKTVCIDGSRFEWPDVSCADVSVEHHIGYISIKIYPNARDEHTKNTLRIIYKIFEQDFKHVSIIADFFMVYNTFGGYTTYPSDLKMEYRKRLREMEADILRELRNDDISTVDIDEIVARAMFRAIWQHAFYHLEHLREESFVGTDDYERKSEEFLAQFKTDLHEAKDTLERLCQETETAFRALFRKE